MIIISGLVILVERKFEYVKLHPMISIKQLSDVQLPCLPFLGAVLLLALHFFRTPRLCSPLGTPQLALALPEDLGQRSAPVEHYRVSPHTRESTAKSLNIRFRVHEGGGVRLGYRGLDQHYQK